MLPLVHEVPKLEITWGGEGAAWRAVTTNLHCSCPLPLTLLLVSWRELTGPAGPLVWPSVLFSTYWTSSCPDKSFQPVKFAGACCMKKLRAWAFQKCKVKGGKNDLFVCFTEGDWKMGDSWYPGLTASCPLVLPSVQWAESDVNYGWHRVFPQWTAFQHKPWSEWEEWVSPGWILTWKAPLLLFLAVE